MAIDRDAAVARIKILLGFKTTHTTEIQNALIDTQVDFEQDPFLPWFLLTDGQTPTDISTVADRRYIAHPTGFLREYEEDGLYYVPSNGGELKLAKDDLPFLTNTYQTTSGTADNPTPTSGAPRAYAGGLADFKIFPLPDAVYTIRLNRYYKADTVLTSNVTNQWLTYAQEFMLGEAGKKIAPGFRDAEGFAVFESMANRGRNRLIAGGEAREIAGRRYVMGGVD